jgi:effector-binding domain-containing protein/uncharacterized protein YndB with AHSA1/START domain
VLKKIFYIVVIATLIFVGVALSLPRSVHVERSVLIDRPAGTVFTLVNGFSTFNQWSPWAERDPATVYQFSGPTQGVGARMEWEGDPRLVGKGWQEVVESVPPSRVRIQLDFDQQGRAMSYFQIDERADGVELTWGFDTVLDEGQGFFGGLLARYFGLFFDSWIGTDYEYGLSRLQAFAESLPAVDFGDLEIGVLTVEPRDMLFIPVYGNQQGGGVAESLADAYREIMAVINESELELSGQPLAITRSGGGETTEFDAAIPVSGTAILPEGRVEVGKTPAGRAVRIVHRGPYENIAVSYERLAGYMALHGLEEGDVSWEQYVSDPSRTAPEDTITHIYFMVEGDG